MTLAADRGFQPSQRTDRRRAAAEPRRSWASSQPFVVRPTPFNDDDARAHHWPQVAGVYRRNVLLIDAALASATAAGTLSLAGRGPREVVVLAAVVALAFVALVAASRGYDRDELGDGSVEYQAVTRAGASGALLAMAAAFVTGEDVAPWVVLAGFPALVLLGVLGRYVHRRWLHRARTAGRAMMRTLVGGDAADADRVVDELTAARYHGYEVSGVCVPDLAGRLPAAPAPVVGAVADVPQVVVDWGIDVVVVAGSCLSGDALRRLSWALDRAGAQLVISPGLVDVAAPRLSLRPTAGLSLLEVEVGAPSHRMLAKAVLDRVLGSLLLLAAAPVIAAAVLAVRLTSPGPAFFRQERVGVDGTTFTMWKIRSMYVDADERRAELLDANEGAGVLFKMHDDPRVTPVGRVLRRYSVDELPQLLNVVRGDMSLVGPRPPLVQEVAEYEDAAHRRLRVKPGLTGLWQISGRSDLSWEESVRLDLRYVDNWSLTMDLTILWKTLRAVVTGSGAY